MTRAMQMNQNLLSTVASLRRKLDLGMVLAMEVKVAVVLVLDMAVGVEEQV